MSFFRFALIAFALILAAAGIYSYFKTPLPAAFIKVRDQQENPFTVGADSVRLIKSRITAFFGQRHRLSSEALEITDSTWHLPYYNSNKKGDRILIEMHKTGDRYLFKCTWWESRTTDPAGDKEIALFLQKGISRYDY
jgi:hypothetical protein